MYSWGAIQQALVQPLSWVSMWPPGCLNVLAAPYHVHVASYGLSRPATVLGPLDLGVALGRLADLHGLVAGGLGNPGQARPWSCGLSGLRSLLH